MTVKQTVRVQAVDSIQFLKSVQEVITRGARYNEKTYVYLNTMPLMAEFLVDVPEDKVEEQWTDNGPYIFALQLPISNFKYTKEQLDEMNWDDLKKVCKNSHGITGRDRVQLIRQYLELTEQSTEQPQE